MAPDSQIEVSVKLSDEDRELLTEVVRVLREFNGQPHGGPVADAARAAVRRAGAHRRPTP